MRQRSTWSQRQAATSRKADIYTMNQEHPQPSPVEYENGDPDSWAETPSSNKSVEAEYDGDHVKRNEIGLGEMREDTFKHKDSDTWGGPGKYDNQRLAAAQRKASYAERVARTLLRTDDEKLVEGQALDLMCLPAQSLVATLKRLDQVSPDALTKEQKFRRALACCKLSQRILPEGAGEKDVERLAAVVMSIDDPTLKSILKIAASVKVAEEQQEEEKEEHYGQEEKQEQQEQQGQQQVDQTMHGSQEQQEQQGQTMSAHDMALLDQMIAEEGCQAPAPAPAPAPELTQLFPAAPVATEAPAQAQAPVASGTDISFDDEDGEEESRVSSDTSDLDNLFSDDPEVQAQREIQAANREAAAGGYGPAPTTRTASAGAKKIGNVKPTAPRHADDELAALWDRPGA